MAQHSLKVDDVKCDMCRTCIDQCPVTAIGESSGKITLLKPEDCMACALCETVCPKGCIQ